MGKAVYALLNTLEKEFEAEKPFAGKKIALSIHLRLRPHILHWYWQQAVQKLQLQEAILVNAGCCSSACGIWTSVYAWRRFYG